MVDLTHTNVKTLGGLAFGHCEKLKTISFPDSLEKIGGNAFTSTKLEIFDIGNTKVTKISKNTFNFCSELTNVIFPMSLKEIEENAFFKCPVLTHTNLNEINPIPNVHPTTYTQTNLNEITPIPNVDQNLPPPPPPPPLPPPPDSTCFDSVMQRDEDIKQFLDENKDHFVIKLPNTTIANYECMSVDYLRRQYLVDGRSDLSAPYYRQWYACSKKQLLRPDKKFVDTSTAYIKIGSANFLIKKPSWIYKGIPEEPRIYNLMAAPDQKPLFTITSNDNFEGHNPNVVSGDHCNTAPVQVYKLILDEEYMHSGGGGVNGSLRKKTRKRRGKRMCTRKRRGRRTRKRVKKNPRKSRQRAKKNGHIFLPN